MSRVMKRTDRPLLHTADPEKTMRQLMKVRYPVYAEADITVRSRDVPHDAMVADILSVLIDFLGGAQNPEDAAQNRLPSAK